jgi:hypothetical protein
VAFGSRVRVAGRLRALGASFVGVLRPPTLEDVVDVGGGCVVDDGALVQDGNRRRRETRLVTSTEKPPRRNMSCLLSSKPMRRHPLDSSSSSRISSRQRGRLLANRSRRPVGFGRPPGVPGRCGSPPASSFVLATASSSSFCNRASAASRSPQRQLRLVGRLAQVLSE